MTVFTPDIVETPTHARLTDVSRLVACCAVAALLATAAGFKLHFLLVGFPPAYGRTAEVALIATEFALAAWLVGGYRLRTAATVVGSLFAVFLVYSLWKGFTGADSCGCFAQITINPWLMAGIDAAVVAICFWLRSGNGRASNGRSAAGGMLMPRIAGPLLAMALLAFGVSAATLRAGAVTAPAVAAADGTMNVAAAAAAGVPGITLHGTLAILEPDRWTGHPFPVAGNLESPTGPVPDLTQGTWTILFTNAGCPACAVAKAKLQQQAAADTSSMQYAVIETTRTPASGLSERVSELMLSADYEWFVQTPVSLDMADGQITAVTTAGGLK